MLPVEGLAQRTARLHRGHCSYDTWISLSCQQSTDEIFGTCRMLKSLLHNDIISNIKINLLNLLSTTITPPPQNVRSIAPDRSLYNQIGADDASFIERLTLCEFQPTTHTAHNIFTEGRVYYQNRRFLIESVYKDARYSLRTNRSNILFRLSGNDNRKNIEEALIILNPFCDNYYHWLIESLPMVLIDGHPIREMPVVIPGPEAKFHRQSLKMLGIEEVYFTAVQPLRIGRATATQLPFAVQLHSPDKPRDVSLNRTTTRDLRDLMLSKLKNKILAPRIYIDRSRGKTRNTRNYAQLQELLEPQGFKWKSTETLSFEEQATLFANAEVIVAPHGAGISNILFAPKSSVIIELFPRGRSWRTRQTFYQLSQALGMHHYVLICDTLDENETMHVPIDQLSRILEEIGLRGVEPPRSAE